MAEIPNRQKVALLANELGDRAAFFIFEIEENWRGALPDTSFPGAWIRENLSDFLGTLNRLHSQLPSETNQAQVKRLRDTATAVLPAFEDLWLQEDHLKCIQIRHEPRRTYCRTDVLPGDYSLLENLFELEDALESYRKTLPELQAILVGLGAAAGTLRLLEPDDEEVRVSSLSPKAVERFLDPVPSLVSRAVDILRDLRCYDIGLSKRSYYLSPEWDQMSYVAWMASRLPPLVTEIVRRAGDPNEGRIEYCPDPGIPDYWIPASEAIEVAGALDFRMTLSQVTKLCNPTRSNFSWRKLSASRRDVHLASFIWYVLSERKKRQTDDVSADAEGLAEGYAKARAKKDAEQGNLS